MIDWRCVCGSVNLFNVQTWSKRSIVYLLMAWQGLTHFDPCRLCPRSAAVANGCSNAVCNKAQGVGGAADRTITTNAADD
jgi:hypothetical protein